MRHVVIEGPDGAGKTALAKILSVHFNFAYHHEGPPPEGVNVQQHYARLLLDVQEPTVFDRLHLGELVYGPLLRDASQLSYHDVVMLNRVIIGTGSTIVACNPPWETCLHNTRQKDELIQSEVILKVAYDRWQEIFADEMLFVNGQVYDYTTSTFMLQQFAPFPGWAHYAFTL